MKPENKPDAKGQTGQKLAVLVVDDHPLTRSGIVQLIDRQSDLKVAGEAGTRPQALALLERAPVRLVITDLSIPGGGGIELLKDIRDRYPATLSLVVSMHDEKIHARRALNAGARGYVMKEAGAETVLAAVRALLQGQIYLSSTMQERIFSSLRGRQGQPDAGGVEGLTDRELQVFLLLGRGKATKEIAAELNLSPKTVDVHRTNIRAKLEVGDAVQLLRYAVCWVQAQGGE